MPATPAWLGPLEALLNRNIGSQARAVELLRRLSGKSLQIDVTGLMAVRIAAQDERLVLLAGDDSPASAQIAGSPPALLQLLSGAQNRTPGEEGAQVRGDAETAALYAELLKMARPDPEEELSRLVGDLPARRAGRIARQAMGWLRGAGRSFGANVAEYLQEESRDLVNRTELEEFLRGVDELREAADRCDARIRRLGERLPGGA